MKKTLFICIALAAVPPSAGWCADVPRQSMKDGTRLYQNKAFDKAAQSFDQAAQSAQNGKLDVSVAKYNAADARYRMGQFGAAATNFAEATRSPDLALQSKAYYNRGNALATASEMQEKQGGLDTAVGSIDEAIKMYENAITLAPGDEDAKVNYELALKKKQELEQKQKQQQQQQKQDQQQQKQDQDKKDQQQDQSTKQDQRKQDQQKDQKENGGQPQPQQQSADQQKQQAQPQKSEEMTPEEAKMMLDAMKQEEQASRDKMRLVIGQPAPVDKDW